MHVCIANLTFSLYIVYFTLQIPHTFLWHIFSKRKQFFKPDYLDQLKVGEGRVHWKSFDLGRLFIKEI